MKSIILLLIFISPGISYTYNKAQNSVLKDLSVMNDIRHNYEVIGESESQFEINGLDCDCCVCFIAFKAREVPGVKYVIELTDQGKVIIVYDKTLTDEKKITQHIEDIGIKLHYDSIDSNAQY